MKDLYLKTLVENLVQATVESQTVYGRVQKVNEEINRYVRYKLKEKYNSLSIEHKVCGPCDMEWFVSYEDIEPDGYIDVCLRAKVKKIPLSLVDKKDEGFAELYNKKIYHSSELIHCLEEKILKDIKPFQLLEEWVWTYPIGDLEDVLSDELDFSCILSPWQASGM